jgi:3-phosphoshikimate 1-carboxyvinyltransferase
MIKKIVPSKLKGTVQAPPSKSDAQRAILAAALSKGHATISNYGKSDDVLNMIKIIQQLGASVNYSNSKSELYIDGILEYPSSAKINCGESGLAARLLPSILGAFGGEFNILGEGTLTKRNMSFFEKEFPKLGLELALTDGKFPMEISGKFTSGTYEVDGSQSSQYISGLLMGLPLLNGDSELKVNNLTSEKYIEMTVETLKSFGIEINVEGDNYKIRGNQMYQACTYRVEGDWSGASFWLVASALGMDIKVSGLQMKSKQADKKIVDILLSAGFQIQNSIEGISIAGKGRAFEADLTHAPDLFPALTVLAARMEGVSNFTGVKRLFNKESNRADALVMELGKLGVDISINDDTLRIVGNKQYIGGDVSSHSDHRMAMALAIFGILGNEEVTIDNALVVNKSYPEFWNELEKIRSVTC